MTCRHDTFDKACGGYEGRMQRIRDDAAKLAGISTPDAENFDILDVEQIMAYLVLRVQYPSCKSCAFEGTKVMVFAGAGVKEALKWRTIDPHFDNTTRGPKAAPSPAARFPGSDEGWQDALAWARFKQTKVMR